MTQHRDSYDALVRCVKCVRDGWDFKYSFYDGERELLECGPAGGVLFRNVYGKGIDEILMRKDTTKNWTFYHQQDHNGNVTELTNGSGVVVETFQYDAFGLLNKTVSGWGNPFLFTGRRYLDLYGIYEYRARAYHPRLGRFTSEDPKLFDAGDYNLFRYCHNDPLDLTDPMGEDWSDIGEAVYSFFTAGGRATFDAQPVIGNTSGKFAVEQGKLATNQYRQNPNAGEAVRHEVWQSELARKYGEYNARKIADAHEKFKSKDAQDSKRDQYHNKLGRENAKDSQSREDSLQKAKKDWESGRAARDKFDPRIEKASETKSDERAQKPPDASSIEQRPIQQGAEKAADKPRNPEFGNPKPQ